VIFSGWFFSPYAAAPNENLVRCSIAGINEIAIMPNLAHATLSAISSENISMS
jgi:hypothetical protein